MRIVRIGADVGVESPANNKIRDVRHRHCIINRSKSLPLFFTYKNDTNYDWSDLSYIDIDQ